MCLECQLDIPRTNVHGSQFNLIHQRLGHHMRIDRAAGWFFYRKGSSYSHILVEAKYNRRPQLAVKLGEMYADELQSDGFFSGIDALVPMPMHWLKRLRRGYNQAEEVAIGISHVTGIPVKMALKAMRGHSIQSRQGRDSRYLNIAGTMAIGNREAVEGKHILIIDDILTTGASMSEAIRAAYEGAPRAISILTLGLTQLA